eukprot:Blabericola_migrator_1__7137@NODE_3614_length_1632_cov_15_457508_g2242_i0_p1_GENE_NODE_3614_length_1632_cov_15_457508_g2242_i0NODE_3614_length_1632_cov_15_457508_g2242_i0_p1_ORF_typecomplete_len131_score15_15_NODE_3614_length_1632_cov_15_457508_g2242_i0137529
MCSMKRISARNWRKDWADGGLRRNGSGTPPKNEHRSIERRHAFIPNDVRGFLAERRRLDEIHIQVDSTTMLGEQPTRVSSPSWTEIPRSPSVHAMPRKGRRNFWGPQVLRELPTKLQISDQGPPQAEMLS